MKKLLITISLLAMAGCSDSQRSKMYAYYTGERATITVHSGGQIIKTYHSKGKVFSEDGSDGYFFTSEETNNLVEVSPGIIIEYGNHEEISKR